MKHLTLQALCVTILATIGVTGCMTTNVMDSPKNRIVDEGNYKQVGTIAWRNQAEIHPEYVINRRIPENQASLVFMRRLDNDDDRTSANISINDRFQVSLQPNGYTQVYSCAGMNLISVKPTGLYTNDLLTNNIPFKLVANKTYYFYVDVEDNSGNPNIINIAEEKAQKILKGKQYQTHQISRVVPKCPVVEVKKQEEPKTPALKNDINIELEVLFDTNKHYVKPEFYPELREVAEVMTAYPNSNATIEGHTDSRAPADYNQSLSQRRADAVKALLIQDFGIEAERLKAIGYGESQPRVPNDTPANLQKNRRVMAIISEK